MNSHPNTQSAIDFSSTGGATGNALVKFDRKDWTARRRNFLLLWQAIASAMVTLMILIVGH